MYTCTCVHVHVYNYVRVNFIFLLYKAYNGHFEVIQELVYKYQMFLDHKEEKGHTPLDLAAFRGHR